MSSSLQIEEICVVFDMLESDVLQACFRESTSSRPRAKWNFIKYIKILFKLYQNYPVATSHIVHPSPGFATAQAGPNSKNTIGALNGIVMRQFF